MPWGAAAAVGGQLISSAMTPSPSSAGNSYYMQGTANQANSEWQQLGYNDYSTLANSAYANTSNGAQANLVGQNAAVTQYGPAYQSAANAAGSQYGALSGTQQGYGATLGTQATQNYGTQASLLAAGQQVYQNSLDPNQALYNQQAQQLQDQTGATNSMYGLGSSAAGAGVANNAMSNFNIDWNAQQLQNQVAGLGAYTSAAGQAGNYGNLGNSDLSQASNMYTSAAQNQLASGSTGYNAANTIAGQGTTNLNAYNGSLNTGIYSPTQSLQSTDSNYLSQGSSASNAADQNIYSAASAQANQAGNAFSSAVNSFGTSTSNPYSNGYGGYGVSTPYYSGSNSYGFTS